MLKNIFASLNIELLKIYRSMIFWITIGVAIFFSMMIGLMMLLVLYPDSLPPGILKTKVDLAGLTAEWPMYIGLNEIAAGAIGMVIFGFIVSWVFGREFNDRTVKDLLALPTSRATIVISKLLAVFLWCILINIIIFTLGILIGFAIDLPLWSFDLLPDFAKVFSITTLLSLLLCSPVAYVASAGKSYLPAIGFVVLCMGLANFFGNVGLGAYFPWAIPLLYTGAVGTSGQLPMVSILIITGTALLGTIGTILQWKYADQNR